MPNRYIRASAIESESVNALSWQAEVFYRRLLNRCDDFGRYTGNLSLLRAALFPLQLSKVTEAEIKRLVAECEDCGLLFTYTAEGKPHIIINKWERGRAKTSEYPSPPDDVCERMQTFVYTRKHKSAHAPDSDSDTVTDSDPLFDRFWAIYPKRAGKQAAKKAFDRLVDADRQRIVEVAAPAYAAAVARWPEADKQYVPHPATWINQGRYDDDPKTWERTSNAHNSSSNGRGFINQQDYSGVTDK